MNYINLDFCIIENPLDKTKKPIIFVTRKGKQYLDETVVDEDDYEKAIYAIQNIGYAESDTLTFESIQDPGFPNFAVGEIKKVLEEKGMNYSLELEENIKNEFELFNLNGAKQFVKSLSEEKEYIEKQKSTPEKLSSFVKKPTYKMPEIGEKLTLYFYLFIDCKFSLGKCYLNLNGDFVSKKGNELRNYLLPFKCDFVRINNIYNPNRIILKSCQTNYDIIKRLPMDFSGSFNLRFKDKSAFVDKLFVYYLMEVKNNFPQESRISIEVDSSSNFDEMITMSKKIKEDYESLLKRDKYGVEHFVKIINKIKEIVTPKMWELAKDDEFEKADRIRKDIDYMNSRIELAEKRFKNTIEINYSQFIKNFHIN